MTCPHLSVLYLTCFLFLPSIVKSHLATRNTGALVHGYVSVRTFVRAPMCKMIYITIIMSIVNTFADGKLSKCAQNHLKNKAETLQGISEEWENSGRVDIHEFLTQVEGPSSPMIYPKNIPELYPECRRVTKDDFSRDQSLLVDFNNGRLGNQISSLASTICLAKEQGLRPMTTHKTVQHLGQYFTKISTKVDILESKFCSPWSDFDFVHVNKLNGRLGQALIIPSYPNLVELYPKYLPTIEQIFTLKKEYLIAASKLMDGIKEKSGIEQPTIVTIHIRRTDYTNSYAKMIGREIVTEEYFNRAIKYVREQEEDPVFIIVSDDIQWCINTIVGDNIFYSPNTDTVTGVGTDLALLALAQVSLLSYGTFGQWGALLSVGAETRGPIIVPRGHELEPLSGGNSLKRNIIVL